MRPTGSRLVTICAAAVVGFGLAWGLITWSPALVAVSVASIAGVAVGVIVSLNNAHSPVGPAVAWSGAAVVAVQLSELLGRTPWSTATWPLNLAGILALLLVFPDGPRTGPLWRALPWTFVLATIGLMPALWGTSIESGHVEGPRPKAWQLGLGNVSMVLLGATMVLAVASVVVRYRKGTARTRRQINWLLLAGLVIVALLVGGWVAEARGATIAFAYLPFVLAIVTLTPIAVGVAVVRHDLFDIDRILSTTLTWAITTTISAGIFGLVVFLVGQTVMLTAEVRGSVAAFAAALVFLPLQRILASRVGRLVDRDRFVVLAEVERFSADVREGRQPAERIEAVLREALDDPGITVHVRTPTGGWSRLDGTPVSTPSGFAFEAAGEIVAMVELGWKSRRARRRLSDVAQAAWLPIEVSRLRLGLHDALSQAQESRTRLAVTTAEERRRLERDLHDRAQQRIVAAAMSLRLLQERLPDSASAELASTIRELKETVTELRAIAHGVRPSQLDDGLEPALLAIKEACPLPVSVSVKEHVGVSDAQKLTAYLVINEAVVNVLKHAAASRIDVRVEPRLGRLAVEVRDDGIGGLSADTPLVSLRDRVLSIGGSLDIASPPGAGTTITAVL